MELFERARTVRLRGHHDKYLYAEEDESRVSQDRSASSPNARWSVEPVPHAPGVLRLRSHYGRYLSASNEPFLLGVTGRKVLQALPHRLDSSVEWVPVRDGAHARLRTRYGNYLRANGGLPPWRNSVTHDVPHRHAGWILWTVEVVEVLPESLVPAPIASDDDPAAPHYKTPSRGPSPVPTPALAPASPPRHRPASPPSNLARPPPPPPGYIEPPQGYIEPPPPEPTLARIEVRTFHARHLLDELYSPTGMLDENAKCLLLLRTHFAILVHRILLAAAAQGGWAGDPLPHWG